MLDLILEIGATVTGLLFIFLLIYQHRVSWLFGIISSILTVVLFYHIKLYYESVLYIFYIGLGVYAWNEWGKSNRMISKWVLKEHLKIIIIGLFTTFALAYVQYRFTDGVRPLADSFLTVFGIIATYLEAKSVLRAWWYWIILNAVSIILYFERGLMIYSVLMIVYFLMSVIGYRMWLKNFNSYECPNNRS